MDPFPQQLTYYVQERRQISLRAFDREVSTGTGFVVHVAGGRDAPPLDQVERWADALELKGSEREEFLLAAALEHTPEAIRKDYLKLRSLIKQIQAKELNRRNQESRHQARDQQIPPEPASEQDQHPTPPESALLPQCPE